MGWTLNQAPELLRFLTERDLMMIHLAVAGAGNRPYSIRGFGAWPREEGKVLLVYVLRSQLPYFLKAAGEGSGMVSGLFTDGRTNESYQMKGPLQTGGLCTAERDAGLLADYRQRSLRGFPKLMELYKLEPSGCGYILFRPETAYIQTPGPAAGEPYAEGRCCGG